VSECNIYSSYMENDVLDLWWIKKENGNNIIDYEIGNDKAVKKLEKWLFYFSQLRHQELRHQNYGKDWTIILTHRLIIKYLHHYGMKTWW